MAASLPHDVSTPFGVGYSRILNYVLRLVKPILLEIFVSVDVKRCKRPLRHFTLVAVVGVEPTSQNL